MTRSKVVQLTVEQQIAQIQKEAADKIAQLQTELNWHKRFETAFEEYLLSDLVDIISRMRGHGVEKYVVNEINDYLRKVKLSIEYHSSTFDNSIHSQGVTHASINNFDLSEYPVYTVFSVIEDKKIIGYVQINCHFSSYNGVEYSNFCFVKPKEIKCTVFTSYIP